MRRLSFLLFLISASNTFAQKIGIGDSLEVSFLTFEHGLADSSQFNLGIKLKNTSEKPTLVYKKLDLGYPQERFANSYILLEKKASGRYIKQPTGFHRISDEALTNKAYMHFDPPKRALAALGEDTLWLSLRKIMLEYDTGTYRIKIFLRTNTIQDLSSELDSSHYYFPPMDKIKYISSNWIHFRVQRRLRFAP
jgi:hypothetical protein